MSRKRIFRGIVRLLVLNLCGCKAFVPDRAIVNGGRAVENPVEVKAGIPLAPTETTLRWASRGGDSLDRQAGSNMAILYYGHKEKPEKPEKRPFLVMSKTIKDGASESSEMAFDGPPPKKLRYRLTIRNVGSANYKGRLELADQLPADVRYLGVRDVHEHKLIWLPYVGNVPASYSVDGWRAEPAEPGATGPRVVWTCDEADLEVGHWITIDIEFEPPAFEPPPFGR